MIRIADFFDSAGMPFLFVGGATGGQSTFKHYCPESWCARMANKPIEPVVTLEGLYQRIFAGALIVAAVPAGEGGFELTLEMNF